VGVGNGKKLLATNIDMKRMKDANHSAPSKSVVQSTAFHPTLPLLFTAGFDKTLRIFQVPSATQHSRFLAVFVTIRRACTTMIPNPNITPGRWREQP